MKFLLTIVLHLFLVNDAVTSKRVRRQEASLTFEPVFHPEQMFLPEPVFHPEPETTTPVQRKDGECTDPNGRSGSCKGIAECPQLLTRLQSNQGDESFTQFLRESNQLCDMVPQAVCCTIPPKMRMPIQLPTIKPLITVEARLLEPHEGCGQSGVTHRKIVGGNPSKLGAWPWMALVGYCKEKSIELHCAGSLVTKRHVVTAAHCLKSDLCMVRLGEHDLSTNNETQHVDVNVIRAIKHPKYNNKKHSDVAVLVLAKDVEFTTTIRPICVPTKATFASRSLIGYTPFAAGWGQTNESISSNVLQEVQIPILENEACKERYRAQNRLVSEEQFDEGSICAGVLSGGKDTCKGDSGGPLMLPERLNGRIFYYNLLGIVSHGIGCARVGLPGVYANVTTFSDWIREKVAEPI